MLLFQRDATCSIWGPHCGTGKEGGCSGRKTVGPLSHGSTTWKDAPGTGYTLLYFTVHFWCNSGLYTNKRSKHHITLRRYGFYCKPLPNLALFTFFRGGAAHGTLVPKHKSAIVSNYYNVSFMYIHVNFLSNSHLILAYYTFIHISMLPIDTLIIFQQYPLIL